MTSNGEERRLIDQFVSAEERIALYGGPRGRWRDKRADAERMAAWQDVREGTLDALYRARPWRRKRTRRSS